jgi:hypothetical protein
MVIFASVSVGWLVTITIGVLLTLAGLRNTLGNSNQDGSMFLIPGVTIIVIAIVALVL